MTRPARGGHVLPAPPAGSDLVSLLGWWATHQPDATAFTFVGAAGAADRAWTYAELAARSGAIAHALAERCAPGERMLLLYPPGLDYVAAFLGCLAAGVIAVPAYPPLASRLVGRVLAIAEDARPALALTDAPTHAVLAARPDLAAWLRTLSVLTTESLTEGRGPAMGEVFTRPRPEAAFLQYTSGSTGAPKGVVVTHANLWHNSRAIYEGFGHGPDSCALVWLPPYHDMGLVGGILQPFFGGFPGVLMAPVTFLKRPLVWLQAISRYGATTSGGPNFAFDLCVNRLRPEAMTGVDLSGWQVAFNGAEPVRARTLARFAEAFAPWGFREAAFYPCYGMAEATLIISGGLPQLSPRQLRVSAEALAEGLVVPTGADAGWTLVSSGRVLGEQALRIVDPALCQPLDDGCVGEVWLAGPSVAAGYWRQEGDGVFDAQLPGAVDGPFLRTGDLGFLWDGELYITGRLKDLIIVDGANHYPQDLEWSAQQSHLALRADGGAAFSVAGEAQEAVVLVHELQRPLEAGDHAEVIGAIRSALSTRHGLQVAAVVLLKAGDLPRTSSGKVQRAACRDAFLGHALPAVAEWRAPGLS